MKKILKWAGIGLGSLVVLLLILATSLYVIGSSKLDRTYVVESAEIDIPSDSASIARGAHLSRIHGCADCHGADFSGKVFIDVPPFRVTASNLTAGRGGVGEYYSAQDFDRAVRNGVRPTGRSLVVMPSAAFHQLSDEDTAALIAYLMTIPPVDNELPPTEVRLVGRMMAAGLIDVSMEVREARPTLATAPPAAPTMDYGAYLASITCAYCHGNDLRGNVNPPPEGSPPAPDLAAAGGWPIEQFKSTLRTGISPDGRQMDSDYMPYTMTSEMNDVELEALHAYFGSLSDIASLE